MQRPNAAQYAYGSAVVVLATTALLLLTGATGPPGIVLACLTGLVLGTVVAVTMPPGTRRVKTQGTTSVTSLPDAPPGAPEGTSAPAEVPGAVSAGR